MIIHRSLLAAALALIVPFTVATMGAAQADVLRPIEGRRIALGEVSGVVYYTVEGDGFRVVATLAQGESGTPVRFEAVLVAGQSVVLSIPRKAGVPPDAVEIRRDGDQIQVHAAPVTN